LKYTYWKDAAATIPLLSPKAVDNTGLYLIRGEAPGGCAKLMPVSVTIGTLPDFIITSATECGKVDITSPSLIVRSEPGLTYTYWQDAAASVDVPKAKAVTATGNYYVKATNVLGCSTIQPLQATVNPYPSFVANPITVTYPATADLTSAVVNTGTGTLKYSYWRDQQITAPLVSPKRIDANGTYYVRAKNELGCIADQPLTVKILAPPDPRIVAPTAFSPNRDGINDVFRVGITGEVSVRNMKVYNRWGQVVFETLDINKFWDGTYKGQTLPIGTYYWVFEGIDKYKEVKMISSGSVTILK
jgi:gliding motility-associated-like protein